MPEYRTSICANSPLGGPIWDPDSSVVDIDRYAPGEKASMAEVRWPNGATVKVGFLNRPTITARCSAKVREIAPTWSQFANIKFEFVEGKTRDVTINFSRDIAAEGTYSSQLGVESAAASGRRALDAPGLQREQSQQHRRGVSPGHPPRVRPRPRPDPRARPPRAGHLEWDEDALRDYYVTLTSGNWDWDTIQTR